MVALCLGALHAGAAINITSNTQLSGDTDCRGLVAIGGQPVELHWPDGKSVASTCDPLYDLVPGMEFSFRARLSGFSTDRECTLLGIPGGDRGCYFVRVNSVGEGRTFAFFANTDGRLEPRVTVPVRAETGRWYGLTAGWDGTNIYLTVDGQTARTRRTGSAFSSPHHALKANFDGVELADVRFRAGGQDNPDGLSLVPGTKIGLSVTFDEKPPAGETLLLAKSGAFLLRYDCWNPCKMGYFKFWPWVNGKWEPVVSCECMLETGRTYRVAAVWDGCTERIWVDGVMRADRRPGIASPTASPLTAGRGKFRISDAVMRSLPIEPPPAAVSFYGVRSEELMPRQGGKLNVRATLKNHGAELKNCKMVAQDRPGSIVEPKTIELGDIAHGSEIPVRWTVDPGTNSSAEVSAELFCNGQKTQGLFKRIQLMPVRDPDRSAAAWNPPQRATVTHYVDSRHGDDAADGLKPATAWKSLAKAKGMTLGPGERLLLKRGSVFNEELLVTAAGAADNWAEIGAYGEGPRPQIRRNRFIGDRCAYIESPRFLVVRDLVVCNAGAGFLVVCDRQGSGDVLMERCLAHHIEGLYRFNSHGIPEWRDVSVTHWPGRGLALFGRQARNLTMRDCEMYQCSGAFQGEGENVWFGRLYVHDDICPNTSPHPVFQKTCRAWLVDSIFETAGWEASGGTMGVILQVNEGLVVRGCQFLNMKDSGSGDQGGIDFEAWGGNGLVDKCTFRNNAGAAIEILGTRSPQMQNLRISGCRFERNNWANTLGPSEFFILGRTDDRYVLCSNGVVEDNGYVLHPGVSFFKSESDIPIPNWKFSHNVEYSSWTSLDRAMPLNDPPEVTAGDEIWTDEPEALLAGCVRDDGRSGKPLAIVWEQLEGPAVATVVPAKRRAGDAVAQLPEVGDYRFILRADDGQYWRTARTAVHALPRGVRVERAWTFARDLDCEGWTFGGLGTKREEFTGSSLLDITFADPVNHVCGDYFVLAMKAASSAHILSPDNLNVGRSAGDVLAIKMQNHTNSRRMRVRYTTLVNPDWSDAKSVSFDVRPSDEDDTLYTLRFGLGPQDRLKRFCLDFSADGTPVTGTCRIDYIRLSSR